jgi:hypothetical protein
MAIVDLVILVALVALAALTAFAQAIVVLAALALVALAIALALRHHPIIHVNCDHMTTTVMVSTKNSTQAVFFFLSQRPFQGTISAPARK